MMTTIPRQVLVVGLAFIAMASCSDRASDDAIDDSGAVRGELEVYLVSFEDGHTQRQFLLRPAADPSTLVPLHFDSEPRLAPWTPLVVWGDRDANGLHVKRFAPVPPADGAVASRTSPIIGATQKVQKVAVVLVDIGGGSTFTTASAQSAVFGTGASTLRSYYNEVSYGGFTFTGDVYGPIACSIGGCSIPELQHCENMWPTMFPGYDHYMSVIGSRGATCQFGGIGGEGSATRNNKFSWYNNSLGCTVMNQEVGHNLGMMHSQTVTCSGTPLADNPSSCSHSEYGNRFTVMGSGCGHLSGWDKWYQGFLGGCNGVHVKASGTFTLLPLETPCNGIQVLQIPMPKSRSLNGDTLKYYYLEYRTKTGLDSGTTPSVFVYAVDDVKSPSSTGVYTYVLDMMPSTSGTDGMVAGATYTDPAGGVTFSVQSLTPASATITVDLTNGTGTSTCIDGAALVGSGPTDCSSGPSTTGSGGAAGSVGTGTGGRGGSGGGVAGSGGSGVATGGNGGRAGMAGSTGGSGGTRVTGTGGAASGGVGSGGTSSGGNGSGGAASGGSGSGGKASGGAASGGASSGGSGTPGGTGGIQGATGGRAGDPGATGAVGGCSCEMTAGGSGNALWLAGITLALAAHGRRPRSRNRRSRS